MAYLDKDGIPRVPEEQEIFNNEISEIHMRLDHICQELRECEILNKDLEKDRNFQKMLQECGRLAQLCIQRCELYRII